MIVHIVIFKFRDDNKDSNIEKAKKMLNTLVEKIDVLNYMEVGVNFDTAERAFDLSLYTTFNSKDDLITYTIHPEHLKIVEFIKSVALKSKVVDYEK